MLFASACLAACVVLGGCQTTPVSSLLSQHTGGKPAADRPTLVHGTQLDWSLKTPHDAPNLIKAGHAVVAPDGTVALGPYGSCKVGGLTVEQANRAVEKHLSTYVKSPTVTIRAWLPDSGTQDVAWRPSRGANAPARSPIQTVSGNEGPSLTAPAKSAAAPVARKEPAPKRVVFQALAGKEDKPAPKKTDAKTNAMPMPRELHPAVPGPHDPLLAGPPPLVPVGPPPDELRRVLLPAYVIGPPDVLQIEALVAKKTAPVRGPHLVMPDGTVRLGVYGTVTVAGLTLDQAKEVIARAIYAQLRQLPRFPGEEKKDEEMEAGYTLRDVYEYLSVDILAFNSKVYYVITDNAGQGEVVQKFAYTGNETVLDAIAQINGLPPVASKRHIWVARRTRPEHPATVLPVDWVAVTQGGETNTNYQLFPGDRVYVRADRWYTADRNIAKMLSPIERLFGASLLGSQTVNSIRSGSVGGGGGGGGVIR
jgi:polysaccharide export outer membrane protein